MCKDAWECYASRNIYFLDLRWINLHQQQWLQARYSVVLSWGDLHIWICSIQANIFIVVLKFTIHKNWPLLYFLFE